MSDLQDDNNKALHSHACDLQVYETRNKPKQVWVVIDDKPGMAEIKSTLSVAGGNLRDHGVWDAQKLEIRLALHQVQHDNQEMFKHAHELLIKARFGDHKQIRIIIDGKPGLAIVVGTYNTAAHKDPQACEITLSLVATIPLPPGVELT